jgi:hypothetical protein
MKTFQVSDELYGQMKRFVVDPFNDTPEIVIGRLIDIADKARGRWSRFDACDCPTEILDKPKAAEVEPPSPQVQEHEVIL